ncbi:FkbM family methyltransferase [Bacillus sp. AK128]
MKMKASLRKPIFMKMWEEYPKLWKGLIDLGILAKYKTLNIQKLPNQITLRSSHTLFVNSGENRGRALLISNGVTQKRLETFWDKAVKVYQPKLVIDVGVNYGECLFSTTYPSHTNIIGIEANRDLLGYIEKSKDAHPNKKQITIVHALASDQDHIEKSFYVDTHWSGTSSASYIPTHQHVKKVAVPSITIDTLLSNNIRQDPILFKVDVEGYEAFVLKGMTNLLNQNSSILGFMEFNSEYLHKIGTDIDQFLLFLNYHFSIFVYKEDDQIVPASLLNLRDLQQLFNSEYIHTDFILVKNESLFQSFSTKVQ